LILSVATLNLFVKRVCAKRADCQAPRKNATGRVGRPTLQNLAFQNLGPLRLAEAGNFQKLRGVHVVVRLAFHDCHAIDVLFRDGWEGVEDALDGSEDVPDAT
jgi:hypothetical protein